MLCGLALGARVKEPRAAERAVLALAALGSVAMTALAVPGACRVVESDPWSLVSSHPAAERPGGAKRTGSSGQDSPQPLAPSRATAGWSGASSPCRHGPWLGLAEPAACPSSRPGTQGLGSRAALRIRGRAARPRRPGPPHAPASQAPVVSYARPPRPSYTRPPPRPASQAPVVPCGEAVAMRPRGLL